MDSAHRLRLLDNEATPIRTFVNRGDSDVAPMLSGTGALDKAHPTEHLDTDSGDFDTHVDGIGLRYWREKIGQSCVDGC